MRAIHHRFLLCLIAMLIGNHLQAQLIKGTVPYAQQKADFKSPPERYHPETWFHLIGGNVSAEGLSVDLEAVANAGFKGVQVFHGRGRAWDGVSPQIQTLSENWDDLIGHVGQETERLGLDFTMQNCPGWAMSGGPWINPDVAMRHLIWSRTEVRGGQALNLALLQPQPSTEDWRDYREVSVIAFPTPAGSEADTLRPVAVASTLGGQDWEGLLAGVETTVEVPATDTPTELMLTFAEETTLRSVVLPPVEILLKRRNFDPATTLRLDAWVDGRWQTVGKRAIPKGNWQDRQPEIPLVLAFADQPAHRFRLVFDNDFPLSLPYLRLSSVAHTNDWRGQAGFVLRSLDYATPPAQDPAAFIDPTKIMDLTDRFRDGKLNWAAPAGDWTILRFGHVNTGVTNKPAPPEATGFECDKLSPRGAEAHFVGYIGRLTEPEAPVSTSLDGMLIDSWECYTQTWTPRMATDFNERRSYSLTPWLPALAGYVVGDHRTSERFLRDWRATISDLLVDNYFGAMAKLGKERGLTISFETAAGDVSPGDILQYWSKADVPMCEMWQPNDPHWGGFETKPILTAASAAHIYGKPIVAAEAFTNVGIQWNEHPFMLKHRADQHFALGLNHLVFHTYTHNPRQDVVPGSSFGGRIGTPFIRGQTWWNYMPDFTGYLSRCHQLLQAGRPVADVLIYLGDDLDHKPRQDHPFPAGYKFDYINFDALVNRISVEDGWLTTPEGLRWRVLWLPEYTCQGMLPETLEKIEALLREGATVIGKAPQRNPSLVGGDGAQVQWEQRVQSLWGAASSGTGDRRIGKGRLVWGEVLPETLNLLGLSPDVPDTRSISWTHRRTDNEDIYFISADRLEPINGTLRFRATGTPELWDAMTGETRPVLIFTHEGEYTHIPVQLEAAGSVFVVFRKTTSAPAFSACTRNGKTIVTAAFETPADKGAPYPAFGIQAAEKFQPWITPAPPTLSWENQQQVTVWQPGDYRFVRTNGETIKRTVAAASQQTLSKGWSLSFPAGWGAPAKTDLPALTSWTELPDPAARVFSGTATYRNTFTVEALELAKPHLLDLGRVDNLAEVILNGKSVTKLWATPFRADLTPYLRVGRNELEIRITNTWHNRLSYDAGLPEADRKTWTHAAPSKDAVPELSGLLGPVQLYVGQVITL